MRGTTSNSNDLFELIDMSSQHRKFFCELGQPS